jgi:hypothetical protein
LRSINKNLKHALVTLSSIYVVPETWGIHNPLHDFQVGPTAWSPSLCVGMLVAKSQMLLMEKCAFMLQSSGLSWKWLGWHTVCVIFSCEPWCTARLVHLIGQQLVIIFCVWSEGFSD